MTELYDEISLIDTNVLVYAYDADAGYKRKTALNLLNLCWQGRLRHAVSLQNLSEFFVIVTKKIKRVLNRDEAGVVVKDILDFQGFAKLIITPETLSKAINIHIITGCPYFDSLIAATMLENGITRICTENTKDFNKVEGIKAVNPFS